jgi:hypothetical protein
MQTERVVGAGKFEIDQMEAIRNDKPDRTRQLLGDVLQTQRIQIAQLQSRIIDVLIATALGPMRYFWS